MKNLFLFSIFIFFLGCQPSTVHNIKFVNLNLEDEGVLNHQYIQTIGVSELRNDGDDLSQIKEKCIFRAENNAKEKLVSILLHIHFSLGKKNSPYSSSFLSNYPIAFTKKELIYWSDYFLPILELTKLKMQTIHNNHCKVILYLEKENLLSFIKKFKPLIN